MVFFETLGLDPDKVRIDWGITPAFTYGLFECRGDMQVVRSSRERYYYFYIDNWEKPPQLCFMERGIRHARVLARIDAPVELLEQSVAAQGKACKEQNYAINGPLRQWLEENVINSESCDLVVLLADDDRGEAPVFEMPHRRDPLPELKRCRLRDTGVVVSEKEIADIVKGHDFFEGRLNPGGGFRHYLVDNNDGLTVTDMKTGLAWQRNGCGHVSRRKLQAWAAICNQEAFADAVDWRLPTIEECLSLLTPEKNSRGGHLHECFSPEQGYIFTADRREPGGFWFVDFRQATVYWAAGSCFSGGFGRLCRTEQD